MLTVNQLQQTLRGTPATLRIQLPDGTSIPAHFHVTEVGRIQKDFVDCGGTLRSQTSCLLQVWVAQDTEHRLDSARLAHILQIAEPVLKSTDLPIEVEYEGALISQYPLLRATRNGSDVMLELGTRHTACLAPDRCGLPMLDDDCCAAPGCCS